MADKFFDMTPEQISRLEANGCSSEDWSRVKVAGEFDPSFVRRVHFGGDIALGSISGSTVMLGGTSKRLGIYNASLYNCTVGDDVYISNTGSHIANYDIGDRVMIENVGTLACTSRTAFGNGVEVAAINEAGGREVVIFDGLTAQTAYIAAMYRHRPATVGRINDMIKAYVRSVESERGSIGDGVVIVNSTTVINVRIGSHAVVDGALSLREGTVNSTEKSPSFVGTGVMASDFIMACSSRVDTGSMLKRCFVGEGTIIENGFSAENSLFFANCHCSHGEACAVFAGPYTVTHHRSTLLIAGYFSFFNAGSGANQSNHMYKSGPVHQGVHLRGCKFGSDAYVMLPARTGAFSVVTGRHVSHYDTADMPFSFIIDENEQSYLVPGINLRSYGTARDIRKWPDRDKRKGVASDIIDFDMMTPYTGGRILNAISISRRLLAKYPTLDVVTWNRVRIKQSSLKKGLSFYTQAVTGYLAKLLTDYEITATDKYMPHGNMEKWVDLSGMITPKILIDGLLDDIDSGKINTPKGMDAALRSIHKDRDTYIKDWAVYALSVLLGRSVDKITEKDIEEIVKKGEREAEALKTAIEVDAGRDSAPLMSIGYGIDCDDEGEIAADFTQVRDL